LIDPVFVMSRTAAFAAGTFVPVYSVRQLGQSVSSGPGSSTAPDNE